MMKKNHSLIILLFSAAMLFVFASCNKLSKATVSGVGIPATPDSVVLKSHVFVIDSTQLTLVSTTAQVNDGIYIYTSNSGVPAFMANDIIIGITGAGYLRKVTSAMMQQNEVTLTTTQARLEDVFLQANINFNTSVGNLMRTTDNTYQYNISNATLYQGASATASITSGNISIDPNWNYNMQFENGTITSFSAISSNATLNAALQMNVTSAASDNINATTTFHSVSGRTIVWIGKLPIVVTTNLSFVANLTGNVTGAVNRTLSITNNDTYTLGDVYSSGTWHNQYNFTNTSTLNASAPGAAALNLSCRIMPQMSIMIYGVVCPVTSISLNTSESGNTSAATGNWDFAANSTQQPTISASGTILGYSVPDNANSWSTDTLSYKTPYKVVMISGDGQIGNAYSYLPQPLEVQVTDNNGNPQINVPVYFSVTSGGGTLANYKVLTNSSGLAQANWILGNPATAFQSVRATVSMANGTQIIGSPLNFIAL